MKKPHKRLDLWHKSMDFAETMYEMTADFPEHEKFGLISQIRRAAISIPANVAEGAARKSTKEFIQFIHVAMGSCSELDTQLELVKRIGYISCEYWQEIDEYLSNIDCMLVGLRNSLRMDNKSLTANA